MFRTGCLLLNFFLLLILNQPAFTADKVTVHFGGVLPYKEAEIKDAEKEIFEQIQKTAGPLIAVEKVRNEKLLKLWETYPKNKKSSFRSYGSSSSLKGEIMDLVNSVEGEIVSFIAGAEIIEGKCYGVLFIFDRKKNKLISDKRFSPDSLDRDVREAVLSIAKDEKLFSRNDNKKGRTLFVFHDAYSDDSPDSAMVIELEKEIRKGLPGKHPAGDILFESASAYYFSLEKNNFSDLRNSVQGNSEIDGLLHIQVIRSKEKQTLLVQFYHKPSDTSQTDQINFDTIQDMYNGRQSIINRIYISMASKMGWQAGTEYPPVIVRELTAMSQSQYHYPYGIALNNKTLYVASLGAVFTLSDAGVRVYNINVEAGATTQQYTPFNQIIAGQKDFIYLLNNVTREIYQVKDFQKVTRTFAVNGQVVTGMAGTETGYIYVLAVDNGKYSVSRFDMEGKSAEYKNKKQIQAIAARKNKVALLELVDSDYTVTVNDAELNQKKSVALPFNMTAFYPSAIAIDEQDNIYLFDATRSRLCKVSSGGELLWNINPAALLNRSTVSNYGFIDVDDSGENVYLSDAMNKRILHLHRVKNKPSSDGIAGIRQAKDINAALAVSYDSLYKKHSDTPEIYIYLGDYYSTIGLQQKAMEMYQASLSSGYGNPGVVEEKIEALKISSLLMLAKTNHQDYENRLKDTGPEAAKPFYQTAMEAYEKILKLKPDHPEAKAAYRNLKKSSAGAKETHVAFKDIKFEPVFSSLYKFYSDNPVGTCTVTNTSNAVISKLQVTVLFKDYMDYPTESRIIRDIEPGQSKSLQLFAVFTNRILDITEDTPVSAELTATYSIGTSESKSSRAVNAKIYNRNAMTWDKTEKLASFVTHRDPVIKNFARVVVQNFRNMELSVLNGNLQRAIQIFDSLGVFGMTYVKDPKTPFDSLFSNASAIDYIQFPRESLKYKSGDCDDLTVLYSALLEHLGVDTAFITVPGHIFLAVNTGVPAANYQSISSDKNQVIFHRGNVWIPVEVTSLGESFVTAWGKGAQQAVQHKASGKLEIIEVSAAWQSYFPVTLPPGSWDAEVPSLDSTLKMYNKDINAIIEREISSRMKIIGGDLKKTPDNPALLNRAGVTFAMYGKYDRAKEFFISALKKDPNNGYALTNMGNLNMAQGNDKEAIDYFTRARNAVGDKGYLLVNLVKLYEKTGETDKAMETYKLVVSIDRQLSEKLAPPGSDTGRAADKKEDSKPFWADNPD